MIGKEVVGYSGVMYPERTENLIEIANDYQNKGWFVNMTQEQINNEISKLEQETLRSDKRTYNGKMTRTFNNAKIAIAKVILEAMERKGMIE